MEELHHTHIKINTNALLHNLETIKKFTKGKKTLAILKKNAYGHGLPLVAKALKGNVDYFGVIYPYEGVELRKMGIQDPILVLGATLSSDLPICIKHDLEFALLSQDHLNAAATIAESMGKPAIAHLKIDTGMGRIGMPWDDCTDTIKAAVAEPYVKIAGMFTHLADADVPDKAYSHLQIQRFRQATTIFPAMGLPPPLLHAAASGGILHYPESHLDMVRPGHILYGVYPDKEAKQLPGLRPVLSLHAKVLFSKRVKMGDYVGYGNVYQAPRDTWISTVGIGYGDGFPRKLTAKGEVIARGRRFPISSSVCMDQLMIATDDTHLPAGEPVTLIGEGISADGIAALLSTVPDHILSNLHPDIPRHATKN